MKSKLIATAALALLFFSCQKEANFDSPQDDNNNGNQNGDLLVKAVQISLNTNDTNYIGCKWNASKRLIEYTTNGAVSGFPTKITQTINRTADNKIQSIVSATALQNTIMDSVIFQVYYKPNSPQLSHVTSTQFTFIGEIKDSSIYVYDAAGRIVSKEIFVDLWGSMDPSSMQEYEYDANGNVIKIIDKEYDGMNYVQTGVSTMTYSTHKAMVVLGEETYIILSAVNASPNHLSQMVSNATSSGTTYTITYSDAQFNSFDRPTEMTISATPVPPGYQQKIFMYYQ